MTRFASHASVLCLLATALVLGGCDAPGTGGSFGGPGLIQTDGQGGAGGGSGAGADGGEGGEDAGDPSGDADGGATPTDGAGEPFDGGPGETAPGEPDGAEPSPEPASEPSPGEPEPAEPEPTEPEPAEPDPSEPDPSEPDPAEPEPNPAPEPNPTPEPEPNPTPEPEPNPTPAPEPEPSPTPEPDAGGACQNPSDLAAMGGQSPLYVAQPCLTSCLFDPAGCQTCLQGEGLSTGCSGCFVEAVSCVASSCLSSCLAGISASCLSCVADNCGAGFTECSGCSIETPCGPGGPDPEPEPEPEPAGNACLNPGDLAIHQAYDVQGIGYECAIDCLSGGGSEGCFSSCLSSETGLTGACTACYDGIFDCLTSKCLASCAGGIDTPGCQQCSVQQGCAAGFESCSGLDL